MKTLALLSTLCLSFSAYAMSPRTEQTEILPTVKINGESSPLVAVLKINFIENTIRAEIFEDTCGSFTAAPDVITCMAMPKLVNSFEVPLQDSHTSCGSKVYAGANKDYLPDGMGAEITVYDHHTRVCRDIVRSTIEVEATTFNPRNNEKTSYYLAK